MGQLIKFLILLRVRMTLKETLKKMELKKDDMQLHFVRIQDQEGQKFYNNFVQCGIYKKYGITMLYT